MPRTLESFRTYYSCVWLKVSDIDFMAIAMQSNLCFNAGTVSLK